MLLDGRCATTLGQAKISDALIAASSPRKTRSRVVPNTPYNDAMAKKLIPKDKGSKLPNAPLVEVVFEMRWQLLGDDTAGPFRPDPGYYGCVAALLERAKSIGFRQHKTIGGESFVPGYSVGYRFYRSPDESFPLIQLGPGIFAVNESTHYTWPSFREQCLQALELLMSCYPKMAAFPFVPTQLELRYIDAFKANAPAGDLVRFLNTSTHLGLQLPEFLTSDQFGPIEDTVINLSLPVKALKDTRFAIALTKGKVSDVDSFVMNSTVISKAPAGLLGRDGTFAKTVVRKWLDGMHDVSSPFFKSLIKDSLMTQFGEQILA